MVLLPKILLKSKARIILGGLLLAAISGFLWHYFSLREDAQILERENIILQKEFANLEWHLALTESFAEKALEEEKERNQALSQRIKDLRKTIEEVEDEAFKKCMALPVPPAVLDKLRSPDSSK